MFFKEFAMKTWIALLALACIAVSCQKQEDTPQVTPYAEELLKKAAGQPPKPRPSDQPLAKGDLEFNIPYRPGKVVILPVACVDGSYAPANPVNRYLFATLTASLLDIYGDIRVPARNAVISEALERELVLRRCFAPRRKDWDLSKAAEFGRELKAEILVIPSLHGNDKGPYRFQVRVIRPEEGESVIWEASHETNAEEMDYAASLPLYETAAFETAEYLLMTQGLPTILSASSKGEENRDWRKEIGDLNNTLTLQGHVEAIRALYVMLRKDPNNHHLWCGLSESYAFLAANLWETEAITEYEMRLRSLVCWLVAQRLAPDSAATFRAGSLACAINNRHQLYDNQIKAFLQVAPDDPVALLMNNKGSESEMENTLQAHPEMLLFYRHRLPQEKRNFLLANMLKGNHASSLSLIHAMAQEMRQDNFMATLYLYRAHMLYAQEQFINRTLSRMKARPEGLEPAARFHEEIQAALKAGSGLSDLSSTGTLSLAPIAQYYTNPGYPDRIAETPPMKILEICSRIQKEMESLLNHDPDDSPHFHESINLSERDALALWQRELIRGPLGVLLVAGQARGIVETAQEAIPHLQVMYPKDLLVHNGGLECIYHVNWFGPEGTKFYKKMFALDINNILVQRQQIQNHHSGQLFTDELVTSMFKYLIASDPQRQSLLLHAYGWLFKLEDTDLAEKVCTRLRKLFPDNLYIQAQELDLIRYREERFNTLEEIHTVYGEEPENPRDLWNLAHTLRINGYFEECLPLFEKAAAALPEEEDLARSLGWLYRLLGREQDYVEIMKKAALAKRGTLTAAGLYQNLAYHFYYQGKIDEARQYVNFSNSVDSWQGGSILWRARIAFADGDMDTALRECDTSFERYQTSYGGELFTRMLLKKGRAREAADFAQKVLWARILMRDRGDLRDALAEARFRLGEGEAALNQFIEERRIFTDFPDAESAIAGYYMRMNRIDTAIESLLDQLKKVRDGVWAHQPMYRALVEAYILKGDLASAEPWITKIRVFGMNNDESFEMLARYAMETGNTDEAKRWNAMALNLSPGMLEAHATRVQILLREGKNKEAVEAGEAALKCGILDDDPRLYYALMTAYKKTGDNEKAAALAEKILATQGPDTYWVRRAAQQ